MSTKKSEPAAPVQASGTMSEGRLQELEEYCASCSDPTYGILLAEIRRLRSPDQRTLAAYQQGVEDGRSAPAQGSVDNPETWKGIGEQGDVERARETPERIAIRHELTRRVL